MDRLLVFIAGLWLFARETLPPLHGEALVYDAARARIVLVGGTATGRGWFGGTWAWNRGWQRVVDSATSPPVRAGHALGFDPTTSQLLLYGGQVGPPRRLLCDTWTMSETTWTRRSAGACITDRVVNMSLVSDAANARMLLLDGPAVGLDTARALRIWEWRDERWRLVDSTGPRRIGFSAAAYDASRSVLVVPVLFGGPDAGVWEWDGRRWQHAVAVDPGTRQTYGAAYDASRRRVVLFGGQRSTRGPYLDDLWSWDGRRWTRESSDVAPPPRGGGALLADGRGGLFVFGGYNDEQLVDLWQHRDGRWQKLDAMP